MSSLFIFFFFNDTATTEIYPLSLHDALPISVRGGNGAQSSLELLPVPQQYRFSPLHGPATNVAQAYARFARDYREGTHLCPTFDDAVTRHRMLDAIEKAAATGQRHTPG